MLKTVLIQKIEDILGGLKFAVILLSLFSLAMVVGTFLESYYGTDFANRTVYKTPYFFLIQFMMFISIVFAALKRLPPKKRLYGFYIIHSGLVLIGAGSFATYYSGVDGSISLPPNGPVREIVLDEDLLKIKFKDKNTFATYRLPYTAFEKTIDQQYQNIKLLTYLPFAENTFRWLPAKQNYSPKNDLHSSRYLINNDQVTQDFTLTLHPEALDFQSSLTLGPLNIHYLPASLAPCFASIAGEKLVFWNKETKECFSPESRNYQIRKTENGERLIGLKEGMNVYTFFPDISPWPMTTDLKSFNQKSEIRLFNHALFEEKPHLFLFGKKMAYYDKDNEKWQQAELGKNKATELPWMGFLLTLEEHREKDVPTFVPIKTIPIQQNGQLIKGLVRAIQLEVEGERFWVTNEKPISLLIHGKQASFYLTKKTLTLPFEFVLTRFKMDTDPGTRNPASYESFVKLFTSDGAQNHHIYMNNPLKFNRFTFYQASYSQDRKGNYHSTLSANYDPGRFLKYLGSLMLVLGSSLHFYLNRRRTKKPQQKNPSKASNV